MVNKFILKNHIKYMYLIYIKNEMRKIEGGC